MHEIKLTADEEDSTSMQQEAEAAGTLLQFALDLALYGVMISALTDLPCDSVESGDQYPVSRSTIGTRQHPTTMCLALASRGSQPRACHLFFACRLHDLGPSRSCTTAEIKSVDEGSVGMSESEQLV